MAIGVSGFSFADMPPHARPADRATLPGLSLRLGSSIGNNSAQQHLALEARFTEAAQGFIDITVDESEVSGVAINGALDVEGDGFGLGYYYQLSSVGNAFITLAARYRVTLLEDDEPIVSGPSLLEFEQEQKMLELSVLGENKNWSRDGWQPYSAFGIRATQTTVEIATSGGAPISDSQSTDFSAQITGGIHYQWNWFSWFLEGTAGTESDNPWQLHTGIRAGVLLPR